MKLKPQPLGWLAASSIAVFIFEGMNPVNGGAVNTLGDPISCGSPWNDQSRYSLGCSGSHVGAIVIMSLAAATAVACLVLFAIIVLPDALRRDEPAPAAAASTTRTPPVSRLPVPDKIPAGWYQHPDNPKLMRYWTGQTFGTVTRERRPDE